MVITVGNKYKTRSGHLVRIYATDGAAGYPIHGAVLLFGQWYPTMFTGEGKSSLYPNMLGEQDLVEEVKDEDSNVG